MTRCEKFTCDFCPIFGRKFTVKEVDTRSPLNWYEVVTSGGLLHACPFCVKGLLSAMGKLKLDCSLIEPFDPDEIGKIDVRGSNL